MCSLGVKISKLRHIELFKIWVQNRRALLFNSLSYFLLYKSSKRLLFSLLIINKYYTKIFLLRILQNISVKNASLSI